MSSNAAPPPLVDDAAAATAQVTADGFASVDDQFPQAAAPGEQHRRSAADPVELDPAALELARAAAVAESATAEHVGSFLSAVAEDDIAVTASFAALQPGYGGWHWSVTLAVFDGEPATISEVVLLPGEGSLLAPPWIPWDQRIRPGDVGVGDLLPPIEDDPRLVPAYLQSDDPAVEAVARELGIGRVHVLSREGRADFAERLHDGTFGPTGEIAVAAPAHCFSCAFYLPLAGSLGRLVGACGNEFSPADGRVVDAEFGCGAHSETVIEMPARSAATLAVIDELSMEVHRRPEPTGAVSEAAVEAGVTEVEDVDGLDVEVADVEVADVEVAGVEVVDVEMADEEVAEVDVADLDRAETDVVDVADVPAEVDATGSPAAEVDVTGVDTTGVDGTAVDITAADVTGLGSTEPDADTDSTTSPHRPDLAPVADVTPDAEPVTDADVTLAVDVAAVADADVTPED